MTPVTHRGESRPTNDRANGVPVGATPPVAVVTSSYRPLVVVEGPTAAARRSLAGARSMARAEGWSIVRGWAAPMARDRVVCSGNVKDEDSARRALLAAVSGSGVIVHATANHETVERFIDDLRRLGRVEHSVLPAGEGKADELGDGDRTLLGLLGQGMSVAEAARQLGIAPRTAERRLAAARDVLGASSNAEAVVAAIDQGG